MKQKFELFKQDGFWTDSPDFHQNVECSVTFTSETTQEIEECHGFPQVIYHNDIEILECEYNHREATVFETECIYQEISFLNLSNYNSL